MSDLVTWLRAQLDEDERVAREAILVVAESFNALGDRWLWGGGGGKGVPLDLFDALDVGEWMEPIGQHIARHDPAHVLADVAAKRAILDLFEDAGATRILHVDAFGVMREAVRHLAAVYADRPGYDESWRPT